MPDAQADADSAPCTRKSDDPARRGSAAASAPPITVAGTTMQPKLWPIR